MPTVKLEDAMDEVYEDEAIREEVSWLSAWGTDDAKKVKALEEEMHKEYMRDLALEASFDDFECMGVESWCDDFDPFDD